MRHLIIAGVLVAGSLLSQPAFARGTWCAVYGPGHGGTNCGFSTYQQCQAAISGNGGFCRRG